MLDFLVAPIIVGTICATIYGLFELFARRKERLAFIEKIAEINNLGHIDGKIEFSFGRKFSTWALKGGCLLLGIGFGIVFAFLISSMLTSEPSGYQYKVISSLYGGSVFLFGGLGLVLAFILEMKYFNKKEQ